MQHGNEHRVHRAELRVAVAECGGRALVHASRALQIAHEHPPEDVRGVGPVRDVSGAPGDDLGVVYVGSSDKSFYAVTAETGKVKWRLDVDGAVATSAAIDDHGRLYFATDTGVVYQVAENATAESGTESELV